MIAHYGMFKTCWDVFVLLSTIYVAVVVPYNACFPETFELPEGCFNETGSNGSQALFPWGFRLDSEIPPPTLNLSSSGYIANQIKSSIFVDVIVEIVFIIGTQCTLYYLKYPRFKKTNYVLLKLLSNLDTYLLTFPFDEIF